MKAVFFYQKEELPFRQRMNQYELVLYGICEVVGEWLR